ncbi:MAG: bestrophin family protein [Flavobacterium sp.]
MKFYTLKNWFTVFLNFKGTDTFRKLRLLALVIAVYTAIICYLEINFWKIAQNSNVRNFTALHGILGFAISLLLAYRTNTAYDRWWEGRKTWGNLLVRIRNFAVIVSSLKDSSEKEYFKKMLPYYAYSLSKHLTANHIRHEWEDEYDVELDDAKNRPVQLTKMFYHRIMELQTEGKITPVQFNQMYSEILAFNEVCGICERIKTSPIPYTYNIFIKKFLFFYIMTMPFGYALTLGYYVVPMVVFVFYVLTSLELIAEEIEDPFGSESNDLPIDKIAAIIKKNVDEILP